MGHKDRDKRRASHAPSAESLQPTSLQHTSLEHTSDEVSTEHRPGLFPEEYFRWRGGEITRLEAFCDVVFGFALTLLVVSLEVPHSYAQLLDAMRGFFPFAICFAQLVMIWRTHYNFSRRYGLEDSYSVVLSMILLFLVLFYVYPLKFVFTLLFSQITHTQIVGNMGWHEASVLMRIYSAGFAGVFLLFVLMHWHAFQLRQKLQLNEVETLETRISIQESAILAATGAVSLVIAFWSASWAGWFYMILGPVLTLHGTIFGKRIRKLAEKLGVQ